MTVRIQQAKLPLLHPHRLHGVSHRLNRELALEAIRRHFTEHDYIPSKIKALSVDKIHAIYIPYWIFTTNLRRELIVKGCGHDGTFQYDRDASCTYSNVTMDASRKLKDGIAKRLEPFHMNELIPFDIAYLSGHYADAYDVPVAELEKANLERCRAFIDDAIICACPSANQLNGIKNFETHFVRETHVTEKAEYALLPAYFVNLKYDTGRELVVVNSQTGKVVGNLPYEKEKIVRKMIKNSLIACPIFLHFSVYFFSYRIYCLFHSLFRYLRFLWCWAVCLNSGNTNTERNSLLHRACVPM